MNKQKENELSLSRINLYEDTIKNNEEKLKQQIVNYNELTIK